MANVTFFLTLFFMKPMLFRFDYILHFIWNAFAMVKIRLTRSFIFWENGRNLVSPLIKLDSGWNEAISDKCCSYQSLSHKRQSTIQFPILLTFRKSKGSVGRLWPYILYCWSEWIFFVWSKFKYENLCTLISMHLVRLITNYSNSIFSPLRFQEFFVSHPFVPAWPCSSWV